MKKPKPEATHRALVGIDYIPDAEMHARLVGGEDVPWEARGTVRVEAGEAFAPPEWVIGALDETQLVSLEAERDAEEASDG